MLTKETLVELYCTQKMSMAEVAKHLDVPYKTVVYWMSKHGIPRRTQSEAIYIKQNPKGDPSKLFFKKEKFDQKK